MKIPVLILGVTLSLLICLMGFIVYTNSQKFYFYEYDCNASFTIHNAGMTIPLVAAFHFRGDAGNVHFDSPLLKDDHVIGMANRSISFLIHQHDGRVTFTSLTERALSKDSASQEDVDRILPDFFIEQDKSITFEVVHQNDGLLFIHDTVPMFVCSAY